MKNTIKLTICAALIVLAARVNALGTGSYLEVTRTGAKTFELTVNNIKGDVKLTLRNKKNEILYQNKLQNNGSLTQKFDMSLFSDGLYKIEFIDSEKSQLIPLVIEEDVVSINSDESTTLFFPVVNQKEDQVSVNMLALNGESLAVKILNPNDEVVYTEVITSDDNNLGKIYDFSRSNKGEYKIELISEGRYISKAVDIK